MKICLKDLREINKDRIVASIGALEFEIIRIKRVKIDVKITRFLYLPPKKIARKHTPNIKPANLPEEFEFPNIPLYRYKLGESATKEIILIARP